MQREIGNEVHIGATVTPFSSIGKSSAIDRTAWNYEDSGEKAGIASYIPRNLDLVYQEMIEVIDIKEKTAHISYKDMEQLDFQIMLTDNYYVNPNSIHLCFPMKL